MTWSRDRSRLRPYLERWKGGLLVDIRTADLDDDLRALHAEGKKPRTIKRLRENLHRFFEFAIDREWVDRNPTRRAYNPRIPDPDIRYLELDEIAAVLDHLEGTILHPLVATAIYAGLRRTELTWLEWDDVALDRDAPMLHVRPKTDGNTEWLPKNKKPRSVAILPPLEPVLRDMEQRHPRWVFASPNRMRWHPDTLGHRLRKSMKEAGVQWAFNDFRHTFATHLAQAGVPLDDLAQVMGKFTGHRPKTLCAVLSGPSR